jgi:hypothetical protein
VVAPTAGVIRVTAPAAGRVEALEVREGEIDGENRLPDRAQATSVSGGHPGLRFVGDAGPPGASGEERMRTARAAMAEAADALGLSPELAALFPLLAELTPKAARAMRDDRAGVYWIGGAFAPGAAPRLRLYINGGCGGQAAVCARIGAFATYFGQEGAWTEVNRVMPPALAPAGLALTLAPGRPTRGARSTCAPSAYSSPTDLAAAGRSRLWQDPQRCGVYSRPGHPSPPPPDRAGRADRSREGFRMPARARAVDPV